MQLLNTLHVNTVLDIGCGNGKLLKLLKNNNFEAFGIERSSEMVNRAKKLGVKAELKELSELEKDSFDCALAVGDVLNYIPKNELNLFFDGIRNVVGKGGYFLADINTDIGFEIADGAMVKETKNEFLSIEAIFENEKLETNITLFEKDGKNYTKHSGSVTQYFHSKSKFENLKNFRLVASSPISMFTDEDEKLLMLFEAI